MAKKLTAQHLSRYSVQSRYELELAEAMYTKQIEQEIRPREDVA